MKNLVVFYSRSGKTKFVAEKIAEILRCDTEEIVDCKNRSGIIGWLLSGRDAVKKSLTEIKPITKEIELYDNIVIGTPVWAGNITPAVRTFVLNFRDKFKNVSFFCTMASFGEKNVFKELEYLCQKKPILTFAIKQSEIIANSDKCFEKIKSIFSKI